MRPRAAALCLIAGASFLLSSCSGPAAVFLADAALEAIHGRRLLESTLAGAARERGMRLSVVWPDQPLLDAGRVESLAVDRPESIVILSPFFSLYAEEVALAAAGKRIIGFYGPPPSAVNLTRVEFEAESAFRDAGARLARWVFAEPGRSAALLYAGASERERTEAAALRDSYERETGVTLPAHSFGGYPARDAVREAARGFLSGPQTVLVVLLGVSSRHAYEFATSGEALLAIRGPLPPGSRSILFAVEDSLADGLREALSPAAAGRSVTVASRLVWSDEPDLR